MYLNQCVNQGKTSLKHPVNMSRCYGIRTNLTKKVGVEHITTIIGKYCKSAIFYLYFVYLKLVLIIFYSFKKFGGGKTL